MPIKLVTIGRTRTRILLISAAVVCLVLGWLFIKWNLGNIIASQVDLRSPDAPRIANWLTEFAPADPLAHFIAGAVYERTFNPEDLDRAVREYESAASLSPHNYAMWLSLGKARSFVGDTEGTFSAYRQALRLAPNYSSVQWIYANALLREGAQEEGLRMMATSIAGDPRYARPAVILALQALEGDINNVRAALGDTTVINAALAESLLSMEQAEPAVQAWRRIPPETRTTEFKALGETMRYKLVELREFRLAADVNADLTENEVGDEKVINGGFEDEVKLGVSNIFGWRISEGTHPQVGLSDAAKRSGRFSLVMVFNSFETAGLRAVDQLIPVEPGAEYELQIYYKSDLRSDATFRWEIVDAASRQKITESEPLITASEWTPLVMRFTVSGESDGIRLNFVRQGCGGPACQMSGRLFFDDVTLRRL